MICTSEAIRFANVEYLSQRFARYFRLVASPSSLVERTCFRFGSGEKQFPRTRDVLLPPQSHRGCKFPREVPIEEAFTGKTEREREREYNPKQQRAALSKTRRRTGGGNEFLINYSLGRQETQRNPNCRLLGNRSYASARPLIGYKDTHSNVVSYRRRND